MSTSIRIALESAQSAPATLLLPKIQDLCCRVRQALIVLRPLLRFLGIYALAMIICFSAWKALQHSMASVGLGLLGVGFLLLLSSLRTDERVEGADELI